MANEFMSCVAGARSAVYEVEAWTAGKGQALQGEEATNLESTRQCTNLYAQPPWTLRFTICFFETAYHHVSKPGLKLTAILLLQAECWDYRYVYYTWT